MNGQSFVSLPVHWLSPIVNQDNVIVAVDMGAANAREVKRMIDRSFTEQKIRFQNCFQSERKPDKNESHLLAGLQKSETDRTHTFLSFSGSQSDSG